MPTWKVDVPLGSGAPVIILAASLSLIVKSGYSPARITPTTFKETELLSLPLLYLCS